MADIEGNAQTIAETASANPTVNTTSLKDSPTATDNLGFAPYVHAVAKFLLDPATQPPLTMSVEGRWGSGKSSFLLQVAELLRNSTPKRQDPTGYVAKARAFLQDFWRKPTDELNSAEVYTAWFNAWRSEKDEALWASFALSFIRQLSRQISPGRKIRANLSLMWRRFDLDKAKWQILQIIGLVVAVVVFFIYGFLYPEHIEATVGSAGKTTVQAFSIPALALWAAVKAKHLVGNPLSRDLKKYIRDNAYEDKISFIDRFQTDFAHILACYAGGSRVFVFIDDLDRCEVPRAAELMQAINLLLSADQPVLEQVDVETKDRAKLFFLLGIDREIVAAGIAAKNVAVLPYLAVGRFSDTTPGRSGLDFGYAFLEKFIQIPFRVPELEENTNRRWIASLTKANAESETGRVGKEPKPATVSESSGPATEQTSDQDKVPTFSRGADPLEFTEAVENISNVLHFNPRRVKQFVNVFRLQILILLETGKLLPPPTAIPASAPAGPVVDAPTLSQIGMVAGLLLRWPALIPELVENPGLLQALAQLPAAGETAPPETPERYWRKNAALMQAVELGPNYVPGSAVVRVMLDLLPDTYGARLKWAMGQGRRSGLLVGFQNDERLVDPVTPTPPLPTTGGEASGTASSPRPTPAPTPTANTISTLTTTPPPPPTPAPTPTSASQLSPEVNVQPPNSSAPTPPAPQRKGPATLGAAVSGRSSRQTRVHVPYETEQQPAVEASTAKEA